MTICNSWPMASSTWILRLKGAPSASARFRGSDFRSGLHAMKLSATGAEVFPRLLPSYQQEFVAEALPSGVPELDELLHGGFERGTISVISGPTGVGKTTLGLQFMKEAAGRGERSIVYTFEERIGTLLHRAEAVHIPVHAMIQRGTLSVVQVEPLQWTLTSSLAWSARRWSGTARAL